MTSSIYPSDFVEALIGHQFYMNTYYQLNDEKKREMYLEVEPHLTISDFEAVEKNIRLVSEKYSKLEKKFDKLLTYFEENNIRIPDSFQRYKQLKSIHGNENGKKKNQLY